MSLFSSLAEQRPQSAGTAPDLPLLPPQTHVVHYNSKYGSYDVAKSAPDGLAVLAALVEVGRAPARGRCPGARTRPAV